MAASKDELRRQTGIVKDHGSVYMLSIALHEMLSRYPSGRVLDAGGNDDPVPANRHATTADIKRWREILRTYGLAIREGK